MESIEASMQQLAEALQALEDELSRTLEANADDRDVAVAVGRQARTARLSAQKASGELADAIGDLKDLIRTAKTG